jgi:predicted dithiol-disulfide oxidoreductase (DUF899 family)
MPLEEDSMTNGATEKTQATSLHPKRFPAESAAYRAARDKLLAAEIALRRNVEEVAAMRRALPAGGEAPQDYVFDEGSADLDDAQQVRRVRLSELFAKPEASLIVYSFMYGPNMAKACPMCTAMLDSLDRTAPHARERVNLVVVAKSPLARIRAHARDRGWRNLRLLSSAGNTYNRDYHGEDEKGAQLPALNVFTISNGRIRHAYCTEMLFAPSDPGQDARHVDMIWPLWNLLDFTREGRGTDWYPRLDYRS